MPSAKAILAFAALVSLSAGQGVAEYGQCGGIGYVGSITCQSPYVCTYLNDYFYQCLPGGPTTSKPTTTASKTTTTSSTKTTSSVISSGTCSAPTNPYADNPTIYLSPYYAAEVKSAIATMTDSTLKAKASAVAKVPNFIWLDQSNKVTNLKTYLADASSLQSSSGSQYLVQIVIYDLPNRDCASKAKSPGGEFTIANNGVSNYMSYIDQIASVISANPKVRVVAVIEPDALTNLVINLNVASCANAQSAYMKCLSYVLTALKQCNVWLYLDGGAAGSLGWPANIQPAASLFAQVYRSVTPNRVRGIATDVANYNALSATSPDPITQGDPYSDELKYVTALSPLLKSTGFSASFIIDQSRSGVQNIRQQWSDQCNVKGAGFGMRPTVSTPSSIIDSIVWVKPGGESDGTSNSSSPHFDPTCALSDSRLPAPEYGTWFEAYFEDLIRFAKPSF